MDLIKHGLDNFFQKHLKIYIKWKMLLFLIN